MTTSEAPPKASFTGRGDGFGVRFPADASGRRSTTAPGKAIFAAAARGVGTPEGDALALAIEGEKDWRHRYGVHATRLAELQSTASPDACVASCRAGLDAMHDILEFVSPGPGGPLDPATLTTSLREAMTRRPREATTPDAPRGGGFRTRTFRGDPSRSPPPGAIPNPAVRPTSRRSLAPSPRRARRSPTSRLRSTRATRAPTRGLATTSAAFSSSVSAARPRCAPRGASSPAAPPSRASRARARGSTRSRASSNPKRPPPPRFTSPCASPRTRDRPPRTRDRPPRTAARRPRERVPRARPLVLVPPARTC